MNLVETDVGGDAIGVRRLLDPARPRAARRASRAPAARSSASARRRSRTRHSRRPGCRSSTCASRCSRSSAPTRSSSSRSTRSSIVVEDAMTDDAGGRGDPARRRAAAALFAARVDARTEARVGDTLRLAVDPSRLYFFSPETGESLLHGRRRRSSLARLIRHPEYTRARLAQTVASGSGARLSGDSAAPTSSSSPARSTGSRASEAQQLEYRPAALGERFGPLWATYWFRGAATVPDDWARRAASTCSGTPRSEATLWLDGSPAPGAEHGTTGDAVLVDGPPAASASRSRSSSPATASSAQQARAVRAATAASSARFDPDAWRLCLDFEIAARARGRRATASTEPGPASCARSSTASATSGREPEAREILAALYERRERDDGARARRRRPRAHRHRVALAARRDLPQGVRTFTTQLRYLDEYPDYRFACSQAQQYAWIEETRPGALGAVRGARRRGQLVPVGGSWVEPDCNLPSGESLAAPVPARPALLRARVRPALHGVLEPGRLRLQRPAPAAHARGRASTRFLTQKLSWNRFNQPEHHTFVWQGIDGSEVLAHFPPGRHLHERGDRRRSCGRAHATYKDHEHSRDLAARLRARRRRRRADARDARDAAPRARPAGRAADDACARATEFFDALEAEPRRAARRRRRALLRVPPRHVHDAGAHEARQPARRAARCTTPSSSSTRRRRRRTRAPSSTGSGSSSSCSSSTTSSRARRSGSSTRTPSATSPRSRPARTRSARPCSAALGERPGEHDRRSRGGRWRAAPSGELRDRRGAAATASAAAGRARERQRSRVDGLVLENAHLRAELARGRHASSQPRRDGDAAARRSPRRATGSSSTTTGRSPSTRGTSTRSTSRRGATARRPRPADVVTGHAAAGRGRVRARARRGAAR